MILISNTTTGHGQYIESPFKGEKVMVGGCHAMSYDVMGGHRMSWNVIGCPMT